MDELEKTASAHCSHLSRTERDWLVYMVDILFEMGDEIPSYPSQRYDIYKKNKVPESVYFNLDGEATHKALSKINGAGSK